MRAQVSFEFMIVFSALLMIFVVVFTVYFGGNLNLFQAQDTVGAQRNALSVAAAINYVYLAGDGASYNLTLSNVNDEENITISDYAVTSDRPHVSVGAPLLDAKTNTSSLGRGHIVITNNKGEIDIGG
ncbi:MAG: hypothetical protein PHF60_02955 [Candidatus ainarchaeum sp.]|nr:hypothetical protein [Candidatus ainarchaeum sp.]